MTEPTFSQIDGSGELVVYSDPFGKVDPQQVVAAENLEGKILETKADIERNFLKMSFYLDIFDQHEMWRARGYESMRLWANSTEIGLGHRVVHDLIRIRRGVLPVLQESEIGLQNATPLLLAAGISKTREVLPLLRDDGGEEKLIALAPDLPSLTVNDVRQEVKRLRGQEEPIDQERPAVFKAKVKRQGEWSRVEITVDKGNDFYRSGVLMVKNRDLARLEMIFGRYVEFIDDFEDA